MANGSCTTNEPGINAYAWKLYDGKLNCVYLFGVLLFCCYGKRAKTSVAQNCVAEEETNFFFYLDHMKAVYFLLNV